MGAHKNQYLISPKLNVYVNMCYTDSRQMIVVWIVSQVGEGRVRYRSVVSDYRSGG